MLQVRGVRRNRDSWLIVGLVAVLALTRLAWADGPDLTTAEQQKLVALARQRKAQTITFYRQGKLAEAQEQAKQFLEVAQQVYPLSKYPDGHPELARGLNNLGSVMQAMGHLEPAHNLYRRALAMQVRLYPKAKYPDGHSDLATSLNNLGFVLKAMGQWESALDRSERALAMWRRLYPEAKYPDGHPDLATSLNNLGLVLDKMGRAEAALGHFERALAMRRRLYPEAQFPDGHPDLATSLLNLGSVQLEAGRPEAALGHLERALAMQARLYPEAKYPDGHPALAHGLNYLGRVLDAVGRPEAALGHFERALAMRRRLYPEAKYPDGHPDLATSLNNLGSVLREVGRPEAALGHLERALAMRRRLYPEAKYPDGHPDLAISLSNLPSVLLALGRPEAALGHFERALTMWRRLYPEARYPDGHPELAIGLHNLGAVLLALGRTDPARDHLEQALEMYSGLGRLFSDLANESDALAFWGSQPLTLDMLLSVSRPLLDSDDRDWAHVWRARSAIARISESRHEALFAVTLSPDAREHIHDLLDVRRKLARLLLQPSRVPSAARAARDRSIRELTDAREQSERDLARLVPSLTQRLRNDRLGPADLEAALPPGSAYVDLLRYFRFAFDPGRPGDAGRTQVPHYVAFVVRPGQPVRRVELGPSAPIDEALTEWRHAIDLSLDSPAAGTLRRLAWEPIARHLDRDTRTVYLVPDGALARLPWAALPGSRPGTVLLEDLAIAVVPHGQFLVQQRTRAKEPPTSDAPVLVVGGVAYDATPAPDDRPRGEGLALVRGPDRDGAAAKWGPIPGTEREMRLVCARAGRQTRLITGAEASTSRLLSELPRARRAHLGTHGFFDEAASRDEKRRAADAIRDWKFERDGPRGLSGAGAGARNPLSYTGLVLAGANRPEAAGPDGGILTGEMILGLDLRRLELAVLSACQTGLGEVVGGQCVQNLQRAFHVAGCRDVIASLWDVGDGPTASLMDAFYKELLENNQPPLEALRTAQLHVYRNAKRVQGDDRRGPPDPTKAGKISGSATAKPAGAGSRGAAVQDWAGFVLSGPGL